jgi:hypothetical protein
LELTVADNGAAVHPRAVFSHRVVVALLNRIDEFEFTSSFDLCWWRGELWSEKVGLKLSGEFMAAAMVATGRMYCRWPVSFLSLA